MERSGRKLGKIRIAGGDIMKDLIQGVVVEVIDRKTFEIEITHVGARNYSRYDFTEHIKIHDNVIGMKNMDYDKSEVIKKLLGKNIRCIIEKKDELGHFIANEIEFLR